MLFVCLWGWLTFCGFVSVCPLHKFSSLPQMLMGQIAQNRCYKLAAVIYRKTQIEALNKKN